jgi:hypothetical protein
VVTFSFVALFFYLCVLRVIFSISPLATYFFKDKKVSKKSLRWFLRILIFTIISDNQRFSVAKFLYPMVICENPVVPALFLCDTLIPLLLCVNF